MSFLIKPSKLFVGATTGLVGACYVRSKYPDRLFYAGLALGLIRPNLNAYGEIIQRPDLKPDKLYYAGLALEWAKPRVPPNLARLESEPYSGEGPVYEAHIKHAIEHNQP